MEIQSFKLRGVPVFGKWSGETVPIELEVREMSLIRERVRCRI